MSNEIFHDEYQVVLTSDECQMRCSLTYQMVMFHDWKVMYMVHISRRMSNDEMFHDEYKVVLILDWMSDEIFHNEYKVVLLLDECRIWCSTTNTKLYYSSTNVGWDVPRRIQSCTNSRLNVGWDVPQRIQSCTNPRQMSNKMFHNKIKKWQPSEMQFRHTNKRWLKQIGGPKPLETQLKGRGGHIGY